jgi:uncharacterized repeat protein (TIGR01451 family)
MRRKLATLVSTAGLLCAMTLTAGIVLAANPSANLDQCANDPMPSPSSDGCNSTAAQWVNGNLGASKSFYKEGDSIPYRLRFGSLSLASHTVTIEWDTTKSGKHALDYIDDVNESVLNANPCLGVNPCGAPSLFDIPADPQVTGASVTPNAGSFRMYGGTITAVSAYSYPNGSGFTGDKSAQLTITFTASQANPVLAWGGHIATRLDWGALASAVAISGSPYHTRLINLDGSGGNQDRSLSADAVVFLSSITIIKDATPNGPTSFPFTASPAPLTSFSLVDNGTSANTKLFSGITNFTTYTVTENPPSGWDFGGVTCTVTSANGGSQTPSGTGVSINLKEGENVTCTFTNSPTPAPSLSIAKSITGVTGGTANLAGDTISYSILVTNMGNVTLTGVSVTDPLVTNLDCDTGTSGQQNTGLTIAVGGSITCTGTYVLQQSDLDNNGGGDGDIDNTATADSTQTEPSTSSAAQPLVRNPSLSVVKTADQASFDAVGDVLTYAIVVSNNGNLTLSNVTVTDANVSDIDCDGTLGTPFNATISSLAPGASVTCTASHTVTQGDLDAGHYANNACADDGAGGAARACDDADVPATPDPRLRVVKVDDLNGGKYESVGDIVHYTITVTNTGNVTLSNVTVTDPNATGLDCDSVAPGAQTSVASLAPGASFTCTASHTITQADLDAGHYLNTACADDGVGGASEACGNVDSPGKNQPTISTADKFIPQDAVTIGGLTLDAGGSLYVELRINETCGEDASPAYSKTWTGAEFTGDGTYNTANAVAVTTDATIRWCSSYSGDANNAARPLSSRSEIATIDFDPSGILAGFGLSVLPMLGWALWSRRRREDEKAA